MRYYLEDEKNERYYLNTDAETRAELEEEFGSDISIELPEGVDEVSIDEFQAENGSAGEVLVDAAIGGVAGMLVGGPVGLVVGGSLGTAYGLVKYIDSIEQAIEFNKEIGSESAAREN